MLVVTHSPQVAARGAHHWRVKKQQAEKRPLTRVEPAGTVNAVYRAGDDLAVRLPRRDGPTEPGSKEHAWPEM